MTRSYFLLFLLSFLLFAGCTPQPGYIVQIDLHDYWADSITSMTVEESQHRSKMVIDDVIYKTIGKEIPPVEVFDLSGDSVNLKDILSGEMIIISCDAHCAWSSEHAMNDFPNAIKKLNEHLVYPEIICLLLRSEYDIEEPEKFDQLLAELRTYYKSIYIIEDYNAMKLNLIGGSGRMIVNKDHIVINLGFGVSANQDDRIFDELYAVLTKSQH